MESGWVWHDPKHRCKKLICAVHGEEIIQHAQQNNKGVLLLAPHYGNWELLNVYLGSRYKFTCLYDPPRLQGLGAAIKTGRERTGSRLLPANISGIRALMRALHNGEMVGILPDQVPATGAWSMTEFFGNPALTMTLPCKMAKRVNTEVVLGVAKRQRDSRRFELSFSRVDLVDNHDCPEVINSTIEKLVLTDLSQYQWEYKRFKIPRRLSDARKPE